MSYWQGGAKKAGHKYGATKTHFAGIWFHSRLEACVFGTLLLRKRAGEIVEIQCQARVKFHTHDYGYVTMIPDFKCTRPDGSVFFVEAKGFQTREWLRKKKAWCKGGPAIMEIWGGGWQCPRLTETLIPENILAPREKE